MSGWRAIAEALLAESAAAWLAAPSPGKTAITDKTPGPPAELVGFGGFGGFGDCQSETGAVAECLARMAATPPPGLSPATWRARFERASAFEIDWGAQARALGWGEADLYGMHPQAPLARLDAMGAAFLGLGSQVVAVTASAIVLSVPPRGDLQRAQRPHFAAPPAWEAFGPLAVSQAMSKNPGSD